MLQLKVQLPFCSSIEESGPNIEYLLDKVSLYKASRTLLHWEILRDGNVILDAKTTTVLH
jgi:hypothetical protein